MISIVIVHYKTLDKTRMTLASLYKSVLDESFEVILVDNASDDGSVEVIEKEYPNLTIIRNANNDGFAVANNLGIIRAKGDMILLLNSDVELSKSALMKSITYLRHHPEIGALGIKLVLPTGNLDHTCKRGFPTPMSSLYYFMRLHHKYPNSKKFGHYAMTYIHEDETAFVDAIVGAFMLMPKSVVEEVGPLDEAFFMYGEDLDYCYRIVQKGYKIVYYPEARGVHHKGASSSNLSYKLNYEFYRAMWVFYWKHYKKAYMIMTHIGVFISIAMMFIIKKIRIMVRRLTS